MAVLPPLQGLLDGLTIADQTFLLKRRDEYSRSAGGSIYGANIGGPIWAANFTTGYLYHDKAIDLEVMIDSLDGVMRHFYAYDFRRPEPIAMRGVPFTDGGQITSTSDGRFISAMGVAAGLVLTRGDYVAFDYGAKPYRYLGRVLSAKVTASGTGVLSNVELRPHLPPIPVTGANLIFKKASALFSLNGPDAVTQTMSNGVFTTLAIDAVQAY